MSDFHDLRLRTASTPNAGSPGGSVRSSTRTRARRSEKRLKVSRACDACKSRKSRCSGTDPCAGCVLRNAPCLYQTSYGRGRPPTPPPLDTTVRVEAGLDVSDHVSAHDRISVQTPITVAGPLPEPIAYTTPMAVVPRFPQELLSSHTPLPPSRASPDLGITEDQGQFIDPSSGVAFLHRARKRLWSGHAPSHHQDHQLEPSFRPSNPSSSAQLSNQPQLSAGDQPFDLSDEDSRQPPIPDRDTARGLISFYFDVCIATYRFLHRPSIDTWLNQLLDNVDSGMPLSHQLGDIKASIVLAVLAIALFHRGKSRGGMSPADGALSVKQADALFSASRGLVDRATGYPTVESVQVRLTHVLFLLHSSRVGQAWFTFGTILQLISMLGIHRKSTRARSMAAEGSSDSYIKSQCRRRVFWVAYILDTLLGVMLGRPRHYHDESIDQEFPDAVSDEDMGPDGPVARSSHRDCPITSLIYHAKVVRIVAGVSQRVYAIDQPRQDVLGQIVTQQLQELQWWKDSLPPILGAVHPSSLMPPFRRQATALRLAHCHATMHLTRPLLLRNLGRRDKHSSTPGNDAVAHCVSAARQVLEMVDEMVQDGTLYHAFWWTHYVTFCALTVVYVWECQASRAERASNPGLGELADSCQHFLGLATPSHSLSGRYSIILDELKQEARLRSNFSGAQSTRASHVPHGAGTLAQVAAEHHTTPETLSQADEVDIWEQWQIADWLEIDSMAFEPQAFDSVQFES